MGEAHQMFDRKLLRARRARFACEIGTHEFLLDHVAREVASGSKSCCARSRSR
jgi:hypothetical protein